MGTLQQQSILRGQHIEKNKEEDLVHELFSYTAMTYKNQTAIYYEGKIFCFSILFHKKNKKLL